MYLFDAEKALKKWRTIKRKGNVLKVRKYFTEPCLCFLTSNAYFLENSPNHDFKYLIILFVKIFFLVIEFVKYNLQIRPAAFCALEESKHTS